MDKEKYDMRCILVICLSITAVFFAIWTFSGDWFWLEQPYNSYVLQAMSWRNGRLSLTENYSHLEIAVFNNKYYVSFPPFPSYVMFPFVLAGFNNCDGLIAYASALTGAVYAFKICRAMQVTHNRAMIFSMLLTVGSNWLFTAQSAWVWFIAQNMAFTLSLMALYYAIRKKSGLSLALWACAVGCRPFQALYLPVILYLMYDRNVTLTQNLKSNLKAIIPMSVIAISYMALNIARFGNPLEFGHNYLPEFTEAENGQFSLVYISENVKSLFRLPTISFTDKWEYQQFNGTNIFLISPVFIPYIACSIYSLIKKKRDKSLIIMIFSVIIVQLLCITAHKTMGGSQFGNRYTNDVLPLVLLGTTAALPDKSDYDIFNVVLLLWGFSVNVIGTVLYYI